MATTPVHSGYQGALDDLGKAPRQYEGTVVQVGNLRGMRLPAGFFHAPPEFEGKVKVTVVADDVIVVSAKPVAKRMSKNDERDPSVAGLFPFMEKQMAEHPEDIVAADAATLRRIGELVKGIEVA